MQGNDSPAPAPTAASLAYDGRRVSGLAQRRHHAAAAASSRANGFSMETKVHSGAMLASRKLVPDHQASSHDEDPFKFNSPSLAFESSLERITTTLAPQPLHRELIERRSTYRTSEIRDRSRCLSDSWKKGLLVPVARAAGSFEKPTPGLKNGHEP